LAVDLVGLDYELLICGLEEFGFANVYTTNVKHWKL